jgi:hypothetical protein
VKGVQNELNTTGRKQKVSTQMSLVDHPFSQPNLDISSIGTPTIAAEARKLQFLRMYILCENCVLCWCRKENCLCSDDFHFDNILTLAKIAAKKVHLASFLWSFVNVFNVSRDSE